MKRLLKSIITLMLLSQILSACAGSMPSLDEVKEATTAITDAIQVVSDSAALLSEDSSAKSDKDNLSSKDEVILEEVTLVHVVDGDTLTVLAGDGMEYKVRLIGIDTPESVHSDAARNNEFGKTASDHTKDILKDVDTLYLEYDVEATDKYNRTLAYVWLVNDKSDISNMLNARILIDGYAIDKVYEPNHRYADTFATLCKTANETHTGLWQTEGYHALVNR